MTRKRYKELMFGNNVVLTKKEINEGYHFCLEWDGLLSNKHKSNEGKCCICDLEFITGDINYET